MNRFSGQELWQFETSGEIRSSPTIVNNIVYFGS
ncbi:MAG: PQQ-binding-like beta-propeller repeat protein [Ardenticatenaceae bacterium]|nr:PQQ-binding-like beta-propeller repeat protein [Ardenticatenaceae bacterium]